MTNIKVYSLPTCPKCNILKKKMQSIGLEFINVDNEQEVLDFLKVNALPSEVPVLHIEGFPPMNFNQAWGWVSLQEENNG